jgi:hypothetical protein
MNTIYDRTRFAHFLAWGARGIIGALLLVVLALAACTTRGEPGTASPPTLRPPTATPGASPSPEPLEPLNDPFAASRTALEAYEPPRGWERVSSAVESDVTRYLSEGNDPARLAASLRKLPKLDAAAVPEVAVIDLNGDELQDVVVQTQLMGLPVIACLARAGSGFVGQLLPPGFDEPLPTMTSSFLVSDLTGDGRPEIVVNHTVQGGSGWTELLYVYEWRDLFTSTLVFHATLLNWAGESTWALDPDAVLPDRQQIVLTYPRLYSEGFDHKMVNHPLAREVWRWDADAGSFVFAERTVDLERSGWGPEAPPITVEDRLRWFTNEGEQDFRSGEYEAARGWYDQVLALAAAEGWAPADGQPDWTGLVRFRRAESLALEARPDEILTEMQAIADEYTDDLLGELATAFLASYGDGGASDAAARGVAAMQRVDLYTHFYNERGGALRFPMDAGGVLYPGAGLAAYLDAYPELVGDREALLEGLRQVGFAAEQVWFESAGDETVASGKVVVALRLPDAPNAGGALVSWALARSGGRWKVVPSVASENVPAWPSVGGFADPAHEQVMP